MSAEIGNPAPDGRRKRDGADETDDPRDQRDQFANHAADKRQQRGKRDHADDREVEERHAFGKSTLTPSHSPARGRGGIPSCKRYQSLARDQFRAGATIPFCPSALSLSRTPIAASRDG